MDKKQCERMFEQMQPPEAVVQRLQQRIHAEEAPLLPSSSRIVRFKSCTPQLYHRHPNAFAVLGRNFPAVWLQASFC